MPHGEVPSVFWAYQDQKQSNGSHGTSSTRFSV